MTITDLNKRIQSFDVELALDKVILNNEKGILDLNRGQLMQGIKSTGKSVGKYRSNIYAEYKLSLNPAGVVDLKLEGDFHAGFKIDQTDYSISSTDEKNDMLVDKYGIDIFGLTKENTETITNEKFTPQLTQALQDKINGK